MSLLRTILLSRRASYYGICVVAVIVTLVLTRQQLARLNLPPLGLLLLHQVKTQLGCLHPGSRKPGDGCLSPPKGLCGPSSTIIGSSAYRSPVGAAGVRCSPALLVMACRFAANAGTDIAGESRYRGRRGVSVHLAPRSRGQHGRVLPRSLGQLRFRVLRGYAVRLHSLVRCCQRSDVNLAQTRTRKL